MPEMAVDDERLRRLVKKGDKRDRDREACRIEGFLHVVFLIVAPPPVVPRASAHL